MKEQNENSSILCLLSNKDIRIRRYNVDVGYIGLLDELRNFGRVLLSFRGYDYVQ